MRADQPRFRIEKAGVVAVQFLVGYSAEAGQSHMFNAVAWHKARRRKE
jgi:hypothetical protein